MSFLAPWFLAGLVSIGVPIAIHLINRERKTVVPFPSLMFIQKVPYKSVRRQKLRNLLLFAMRFDPVIVAKRRGPASETGPPRDDVLGAPILLPIGHDRAVFRLVGAARMERAGVREVHMAMMRME